MVKQKKNKFKTTSKPFIKSVDRTIVVAIKKVQQDLQRKENIEFGRKAQTVSFQFASKILATRIS